MSVGVRQRLRATSRLTALRHGARGRPAGASRPRRTLPELTEPARPSQVGARPRGARPGWSPVHTSRAAGATEHARLSSTLLLRAARPLERQHPDPHAAGNVPFFRGWGVRGRGRSLQPEHLPQGAPPTEPTTGQAGHRPRAPSPPAGSSRARGLPLSEVEDSPRLRLPCGPEAAEAEPTLPGSRLGRPRLPPRLAREAVAALGSLSPRGLRARGAVPWRHWPGPQCCWPSAPKPSTRT